ncbi:Rpn family recombination-promoting nuclease/putative transposase [Paraliomyxa miuraensis]|uniref:Rpn family recombination-promoting nuclease/putative transposase n=1 Tax=Paraliomyxa miuraensis TaxID=376150 RepID=UPI0022520CB7|nr:Rpn family recombination-promoting nuclease/putative transposase [Paraliomyxa miuraensis]MCX4246830.1 Rpn family recombination-promoting nuclease/putative transposase [Paraliomyxa miuraensis]
MLDPKNDFVFKTMLTRRVELLRHMLEGILGRPIRAVRVIDPDIPGEQLRDKEIVLDVRAVLDDGTRAIIEMQLRLTAALTGRLTYYLARDFVDQLRRGEGYERLTPSVVIVWLPKPLLPEIAEDLHSVFELRERRRGIALGQYLSIHVIQPSALSSAKATGYDAIVERWARFFVGYDDPEVLAQLAAEDSIMALATQTLEEISQDPEVRRLALEREDERKLHRMDLAACRAEGWNEGHDVGHDAGRATLLLEQLGALFGSPSEAIQARVRAGTAEELRTWGLRVLGAKSLSQVFGG